MLLVRHDQERLGERKKLGDETSTEIEDLAKFDALQEAQLLYESIQRGEHTSPQELLRCLDFVPDISQSSFVIENARDYQRQVT
jgi:hypothetical protein